MPNQRPDLALGDSMSSDRYTGARGVLPGAVA